LFHQIAHCHDLVVGNPRAFSLGCEFSLKRDEFVADALHAVRYLLAFSFGFRQLQGDLVKKRCALARQTLQYTAVHIAAAVVALADLHRQQRRARLDKLAFLHVERNDNPRTRRQGLWQCRWLSPGSPAPSPCERRYLWQERRSQRQPKGSIAMLARLRLAAPGVQRSPPGDRAEMQWLQDGTGWIVTWHCP